MPTISEIDEPWLQARVVLILCGLIASGKSTFAEHLQHYYPQFHRCNQDDLGDRRQVERLAREMLSRGQSVCIDRTNFNASQRSYWIEIAREFPGTSIWVIVFDTPYEVCATRLQTRTSHPTIKSSEQGLHILSRFATDFVRPAPHEGYDRIISLKPADHPSPVYSRSEIAVILRRIHDSAPVSAINSTQSCASQSYQGWQSVRNGSFRGYPARSYFDTRSNSRSRSHNFSTSPPLGGRPAWRKMPVLGNVDQRGTGHNWVRHPGQHDFGVKDHETQAEAALSTTHFGTGIKEDPLMAT